jgi:hypothetical protein
MIGYGLKFSIRTMGTNSQDFSHYGKLAALHIFLYIFYIAAAMSANRDLEEEINDGFIEISLLSLTRLKFFLGKYLAYVFCYFLLLELVVAIGSVSSKLILGAPFNLKIFFAFAGLGINVAFVIALMFLFVLRHNIKGAGFIAFLIYVLFSLLNSSTVMSWVFKSDAAADVISTYAPAVTKLQNEFLRFGTNFGFTGDLPRISLNFIIYIVLIVVVLVRMTKKYECDK